MNAFNKIVGLTLILGLFSACGNKPNPEKEKAYQKAASILTADESFFPIIDEELYYLVKYFNNRSPKNRDDCLKLIRTNVKRYFINRYGIDNYRNVKGRRK